MKSYTCDCLNIKIHTKSTEKILNPAQLGIEIENEVFFTLNIAEAQLDLAGVNIRQAVLVKKHSAGEWLIHQCLNCDTRTHASRGTKILVNLSLSTDITSIESSSNYSPLYKMVLKGNDNQMSPSRNLHSSKYAHLQKTLSTIQQQLSNFIESEKSAMEERIRAYEKEQKAKFATLTGRMSRDKTILINKVLAVHEAEEEDEGREVFCQSDSDTTSITHSGEFLEGPEQIQEKYFNPLHMVPQIKGASSHHKAVRPKSHGDEDMFDLEGLDEEDESRPFYVSDDENDDTDDSINEEPSTVGRLQGRSYFKKPAGLHHHMYSQSVPISVPQQWRHPSQSSLEDDDDDDQVPAPHQPEDIAASIQALARSVHGDTTEIFGDLPRRRLNTMDMGKL